MINCYSSGQSVKVSILATVDRLLAKDPALGGMQAPRTSVPSPSETQIDAYRQIREEFEKRREGRTGDRAASLGAL